MTQFARKNVLITGGASGIGRRMAEKIAGKGGTVIIWDIDQKKLSHVESELKKPGCNLFTYICDVSDRKKVYFTAEQVKKDIGKVDILINNAGIVSGKPLLECTDEQIEKTFQVNSLAFIWTIRAFL
ncbi:MAG: SDR family NAD(P)-dependent oxidoreductase, partial [Desulfobacterales bacterium]